MRILYFECFSGISGDMTLGALLDIGVGQDRFMEELKKLHLGGYRLEISRGIKNGITGTNVEVILDQHDVHNEQTDQGHEIEDHTHNHGIHDHHHSDHTHSDEKHHDDSAHSHEESKHGHDHSHSCGAGAHKHDHKNRSYMDIKKLIEDSGISDKAKDTSIRIFTKLAVAEGKIHGVPMEEVHFHEVGAVDSIVDIVGTAILLDILEVDTIIASALPVGSGMVKCQHGMIPVPAPATLELLKGIPVYDNGIKGEVVTPTGAAILSALCTDFGGFPTMVVHETGYGMGKKSFDIPNCLRVCMGEELKK